MTATTRQIRFMANNFLGGDILSIPTSEEANGNYPVENLYDQRRAKPWVAGSHFEITSANNKLYFNDGSLQTATIAAGHYTFATLKTAVDAAFAGAMTLSYVTSSPRHFKLVGGVSGTLVLSTQTNAMWSTLGFTGTTDRTGTTFEADAPRNHTSDRIVWDLGVPRIPTFFGAVDRIDEPWSLSSAAVITLKANSVNDWSAAPFSLTLTRTDAGAFAFLDSIADREYRYWALEIADPENPGGTDAIRVGYVYLGDHITTTTSNVAVGFEKYCNDPSTVQLSESGVVYANRLTPYRSFRSAETRYLEASERRDWEQAFYDAGTARTFFVSLDPALEVSEDIEEYTFYARFESAPTFRHVIRDLYTVNFSLVEAV